MKTLLSLCFLFFSLSGLQAQPPNVVLVMTDDQGYGEFSFNQNPLVKTPHIDKLASEGIRFTDFHVSPMCTPTRGSLLTGLDPFRNGAVNVSSGRTLLRPELTTMADIFQQAGYETGIFGKWHLGDNYPFRPEDRGFMETLWFPSSHINSVPDFWDNDYFNDTYIHNGQREDYDGYCTDVFFDEAIRWMSQTAKKEQPFFAYIPLNAAHWPHFVPDSYRRTVEKSLETHPEVVSHMPANRKTALTSFLAMGLNIDENMGKLQQFMEQSGLSENTILVFLTDNGSTFGQDYFNAGMRGTKTELWEGGHRVPLLIKAPAHLCNQPSVIQELCQVQDLLPTLTAMAGIDEIPENLDGVSLLPLMNGEKKELDDRMLVINYSRMPDKKVTYTTGNPAIPHKEGAAVLWNEWRWLENRELYHIDNDPHQDQDVADRYPEVVTRMRNHLDIWWEEVRDDVFEVQRVIIGNDAENPTLLTACEWLDVFVDQQSQIRRGVRKNGIWHIHVDQPGMYEFELRRWPRESGVALRDSLPPLKVTDGTFIKGAALPVYSAEIQVGSQKQTFPVRAKDQSVSFTFSLEEGETTIQTWFRDKKNAPVCGAYYMYINRK